jgi:hypothetical protein
VIAATLVAPTAGAQTPPKRYFEERPILAYYYTWWDPSNFDRTLYKPTRNYNSDEPAIMRQHMQQAQSAGIDGFVVSWYGISDRTDKNFGRMLEMAKENDFRLSIHFETPLFAPFGPEDVELHLRLFYEQYLNHPNMITYGGKPMIFFWRASTFDNATWASIREHVDPEHRALWIADGDDFNIIRGSTWDGISPYAIAWSANPTGQIPSWGQKSVAADPNKLYIPPVSPGCDDTAARPATCIKDRGDGSYYQASLQGALNANVPAVMVSTWNEWMESTQIEPGTAYGDLYLQLTRQFAEQFKGPEGAARIP